MYHPDSKVIFAQSFMNISKQILIYSEYFYIVVRKFLNIVKILLVHFLVEDQTLLEYYTHILSQYNIYYFDNIIIAIIH